MTRIHRPREAFATGSAVHIGPGYLAQCGAASHGNVSGRECFPRKIGRSRELSGH